MRERRKQIVFISVVLLAVIILAILPGMLPRMRPMKAVYLEDESGSDIFVDLKDGFPFVGRIPQERLYEDQDNRERKSGVYRKIRTGSGKYKEYDTVEKQTGVCRAGINRGFYK